MDNLELASQIPSWMWFAILAVDLAVIGFGWLAVSTAASRLGLDRTTQQRLRFWTAVGPLAWLAVAPIAAAAVQGWVPGVAPGAPSAATLPLVLAPLGVGLGLLANPTWRRVLGAIPQSWMVGVQFYRNIGAIFLVLMGLGVLPAYFAYPSGYGDLISGLPTLFVAYLAARQLAGWRLSVLAVNVVGMLDFVVAVGIGSGILHNAALSAAWFGTPDINTAVFALPPLSLIPLFVVPVGLVIHTYSLLKLVGWLENEIPVGALPVQGSSLAA